MDDATRAAYETKGKEIRAALKSWENEWATTHGGSKPGRQDIKENPDIGMSFSARPRNRVKGADGPWIQLRNTKITTKSVIYSQGSNLCQQNRNPGQGSVSRTRFL
jgi:hypothetical protein